MFEELFNKYDWETVKERIYNSTDKDVENALAKEYLSPEDFYALLSPASDSFLEKFARISLEITRKRFGNIIQLYAPIYISNECQNSCVYCGFNVHNKIPRITLTGDMLLKESEILYTKGFRHILLVTGENRKVISPELLSAMAGSIHRKFASVSIEVYPLETSEYKLMAESGIDGLALYQETYDRKQYDAVHPGGMKKNFSWRLNAPERAGDTGFRKIGIGALLGLSDWRVDSFFCALHAHYLTKKYWKSQVQVSFPRLREAQGGYSPPFPVTDRDMTHLICAMRIILPDAGLALSTRESAKFRDNVMPLGITMMSAGSKTEPGGYSAPEKNASQFTVHDERSPVEIAAVIAQKGFDPVWKDWDKSFLTK
jgi:2-iminoacetate synthase